jgi:hypothetical protein
MRLIALTTSTHCGGCEDKGSWISGKSTHLHIFQAILLTYTSEHILLAALLHLARKQKLIEDEVRLLKVEDDVELANVAVILVHLLNISMHNFEGNQLVIGGSATGDEEEGGITAVDDLGV